MIVVQFIAIIPSAISYLLPREIPNDDQLPPLAQWPSEFESPVGSSRCLSYNPRTHSDAIHYATAAGCTGAKAEIWLHGTDLLVGSSFANLDEKYTLQSLYLDPLLAKLESRRVVTDARPSQTGLFSDPAQSFVLLLDLKTSQHAALPQLVSQLDGLRQKGYLTRMEGEQVVAGPVTVVIAGQGGWNLGDRAYHDELFFDASLDELTLEDYDQPWRLSHRATPSPLTPASSVPSPVSSDTRGSGKPSTNTNPHKDLAQTYSAIYSATANFHESIGHPRQGRFSPQQIALIRAQIRAAHRRGIRVRYEGIPQGRGRLSEHIWRALVQEGADVIDVDWQESYQQAWWQRWMTYRPT